MVEPGFYTPVNLDLFMHRLGQSSATKTLRSLAIVEPSDRYALLHRTVSLEAFVDCVCNLSGLEALKLKGVSIGAPAPGPSSRSRPINLEEPGEQRVARKVKSLSVLSNQPAQTRMTLMYLFPVLEILNLNQLEHLLDVNVYHLLTNHLKNQHGPGESLPLPFPRLKVLDAPLSNIDQWRNSTLLRCWLSKERGIRLGTLDLLHGMRARLLHPYEEMAKIFDQNRVSVRHLRIDGTMDPERMQRFLDLPILKNLEGLEVLDSGCGSIEEGSDCSFRQFRLGMARMFTRATWKRTLTRLNLLAFVDDFEVDGVLTSVLQLLPVLTDFEIQHPIQDLSFFQRVGRCAPATSAMAVSVNNSPVTATTTKSTLEGPILLENYCFTERPPLQRLRLRQCSRVGHLTEENPLAPSREQLQFKFRFLSELKLEREMDPCPGLFNNSFSEATK